jgi:HEAT repeat protein
MKRRFYFYGSVILLTAGLLIWYAASRPPAELMHDGRPLSVWLNEVGEGPEEQRTRAVAALLAMDPDIWDRLVNKLAVEDSFLRRTITRLGGERAFQWFSGRSADEQHGAAAIAFLALGSSARPAVPGLIDLLRRPSARERAADALAAIGPEAVPALTQALTNANPEVHRAAAAVLDKIHWERGR